jgi:drug/metabolite transporter (DMT)-like permease
MRFIDLRVMLYLMLAALLWAGNAVVGRLLVGEISPLLLSTVRCLVAIAVLLPFGVFDFEGQQPALGE